jgi:hypothetical protein
MVARVADEEAIGNNRAVLESTFGIVVFGAVGLSIVMCLVFLFTRGPTHDEIGIGGLVRDSDAVGGDLLAPPPDSPAARAERELEVRQMVNARSDRRVSRGEPALDVEAEVARLLAPPQPEGRSPGLIEEVRQLVVARNERRVRQGLEPLDVDAEVERTLEELGA